MRNIRTYSELIKLKTLEERFEYLKLDGLVGEDTFGFDRYLNQTFYKNKQWKSRRNSIIVRDNGNELGLLGYEIPGSIYVHHMNPITIDDIEDRSSFLLNPEYLICTSFNMHNAIHYGNINFIKSYDFVDRSVNDTKLW